MLSDFSAAYDLKYTALRYFNAAGADPHTLIGEWHEPETHLIPLVLFAAIDPKKSVHVFGSDYDTPDGTCIRDYVHVIDLAQAHILALERLFAGEPSSAFNLGNGTGFSVNEVIQCARETTQQDIHVIQSGRRPGDPAALVGDSSLARRELGGAPKLASLNQIMETTWAWEMKKQNAFRN